MLEFSYRPVWQKVLNLRGGAPGKFVLEIPAGKLASVHTMAASGPIRRTTSVTLREPVTGELPLAQKLVQISGLTTALLLLGES